VHDLDEDWEPKNSKVFMLDGPGINAKALETKRQEGFTYIHYVILLRQRWRVKGGLLWKDCTANEGGYYYWHCIHTVKLTNPPDGPVWERFNADDEDWNSLGPSEAGMDLPIAPPGDPE
jgi:hypothetical protein